MPTKHAVINNETPWFLENQLFVFQKNAVQIFGYTVPHKTPYFFGGPFLTPFIRLLCFYKKIFYAINYFVILQPLLIWFQKISCIP